jgi:hypothetical protein
MWIYTLAGLSVMLVGLVLFLAFMDWKARRK